MVAQMFPLVHFDVVPVFEEEQPTVQDSGKMRRPDRIFVRVTVVVLVVVILIILKMPERDITRFKQEVVSIFEWYKMPIERQIAKGDKWILVDAANIPPDQLSEIETVPGWTVLVYGTGFLESRNRCQTCIFYDTDVHAANTNPPTLDGKHISLSAALYAIRHGAKWIYPTAVVKKLEEQVQGFNHDYSTPALLYQGDIMFDSDRHFGLKDNSKTADRNRRVSYQLGTHRTPSIQTKWQPPTGLSSASNISCRLPHAVVPAVWYPFSHLHGHLLHYRSFWALVTLSGKEKGFVWASWLQYILTELHETVGVMRPACGEDVQNLHTSSLANHERIGLFRCEVKDAFNQCVDRLSTFLLQQRFFTQTDIELLRQWFRSLADVNYQLPERNPKVASSDVPTINNVLYEPNVKTQSDIDVNPFQGICPANTLPPIGFPQHHNDDILLVVIFNFPTYYSNVMYLNYIYRKYFTNIVYCGSLIGKFKDFQKGYQHPVTFLEVNEIFKGIFGYLCAVKAMEMGYNVEGYFQMSDDVLLNLWNVGNLPKDKFWFQHSIRKGSLFTKKVPNITPMEKQWFWLPWNSPTTGVARARNLWLVMDSLRATQLKQNIESFTKQLEASFGGDHGIFYEASDIFYVPARHTEKFRFYMKLWFSQQIFLEIAVPSVFCGIEHIDNVHKLSGSYLWYKQRQFYEGAYNSKSVFLHAWKLKALMQDAKAKLFICTKYLPFVEGHSIV